jgi:TatD DNase family protein
VARAVFHWYSGPLDVLGRLLEDGYCISATPALARSQAHRAAIALAPPERILLETDAPVPWQGRPSTPADLPLALTALADLRGWSEAETAALTTANTERLLQSCR